MKDKKYILKLDQMYFSLVGTSFVTIKKKNYLLSEPTLTN